VPQDRNQEDEGLGRSKGGVTTKIHVLVDALGQVLKCILMAGNRNDITQGPALVEGVRDANILADKGYDWDAFVLQLEAQQYIPLISPPKKRKLPRAYNKHLSLA